MTEWIKPYNQEILELVKEIHDMVCSDKQPEPRPKEPKRLWEKLMDADRHEKQHTWDYASQADIAKQAFLEKVNEINNSAYKNEWDVFQALRELKQKIEEL